MEKLLPLLGAKKIEENCFTQNFSNAFQEQKKSSGLKLTQNPYALVEMKDLMKTPFPLAGKSCFHSQEYLQKSKKMVPTSRNNVFL